MPFQCDLAYPLEPKCELQSASVFDICIITFAFSVSLLVAAVNLNRVSVSIVDCAFICTQLTTCTYSFSCCVLYYTAFYVYMFFQFAPVFSIAIPYSIYAIIRVHKYILPMCD